jgi:hypothetical protein
MIERAAASCRDALDSPGPLGGSLEVSGTDAGTAPACTS